MDPKTPAWWGEGRVEMYFENKNCIVDLNYTVLKRFFMHDDTVAFARLYPYCIG
jgi:hypothetical protein